TVLSNLLPLFEEGFKVGEGNDRVIRGKNCREVTVTRPGRAPMKLLFDKQTDLLFKADFQGKFLDTNNRFAATSTYVEFYFSEYQIFDGVKHWKKQEQWRDGKKFSEINLSDVTFLAELDDSHFVLRGMEAKIREISADYAVK